MISKQFGGRITDKWKNIYKNSENWANGRFRNLTKTETGVNIKKLPRVIIKQIQGRKNAFPSKNLPIVSFDTQAFLVDTDQPKFVWYGHSVLLIRLSGKTILIDPMFGEDAAPIAPTKTRRFSKDSLKCIEDLPQIDLVLLTHDHYDHLDYASIQLLKKKTKDFYVSLGIKRHLMHWGIGEHRIKEFDWWDSQALDEIKITFTPTRHFSGRGLTSLAKCLWGGWHIQSPDSTIWFSGDGGYGAHFTEIHQQLGPVDIAFMECGQYCIDWPQIHMFPSESVQAALDCQAKNVVPVHWAGFNLSYYHSWYEPVEEFMSHVKKHSLNVLTPKIGEVFDMNSRTSDWWSAYK